MTMKSLLFTENGASQNADEARLLIRGLLGGVATTGVLADAYLKVTQRAAGVNMSVDVAPGHMLIEGQRSTVQGTYHLYNDAVINVPLSAADPTNPRIDVIYVRLRDSAYDAAFAGQDDSPILVAQGTAAGSPTAPTPSGTDFVVLARVAVAAAATTIVNGNITDYRTVAYSSLKPWDVAWGRLDDAEITSDVTATSLADAAGLAVTWTAIAGRKYRIGFNCYSVFSTVNASAQSRVYITTSGNVVVQQAYLPTTTSSFEPCPLHMTRDLPALTAGSVTYKVRHERVGSGDSTIAATSTAPAQLWVDDIGPT